MSTDKISHGVQLITGKVGEVEAFKGRLTIKLNAFGFSYDGIKDGGFGKQSGLVFENEITALNLLIVLQNHFGGHNKVTLGGCVVSRAHDMFRTCRLIWLAWKKK